MGVTSSCDEKIYLSPLPEEPDVAHAVSDVELVGALERRTRELADGERIELDLRADDPFDR